MALQLLKDGKTFAEINSDEPKICFLHGWGRSSNDFSKISNKFESIAIDLPGFGISEEPQNSMNPKEYAEHLINLIPDTVQVLVGHSFGGKIAVHMSFIREYKKLVLIGTPLIRKNPQRNLSFRLNLYKFLNSLNLFSDKSVEKYKNKHGSEDYKNAEGVMRDTLVKTVNDDLSQLLPKINTKVNLIWGENDTVIPLSIGEEANTKIKESKLTIIKNEGHNMLKSNPDEIIRELKEL